MVHEQPKIHHPNNLPSKQYHSISDETTGLSINLSLSGIFSVFNTRTPNDNDFIDEIPVVITPEEEEWNPNSDVFSRNENSYTDEDGNMISQEHMDANLIEDDDLSDEYNISDNVEA